MLSEYLYNLHKNFARSDQLLTVLTQMKHHAGFNVASFMLYLLYIGIFVLVGSIHH